MVASFFSHHLCVFDMDRKDHIQTLESDSSLLHLYVSALTHDGSCLVHTNYDEDDKASMTSFFDKTLLKEPDNSLTKTFSKIQQKL